MNSALTSDMLVCAFLSQDPGEHFSVEEVAAGIDGNVHLAIVRRALMRQAGMGVISHIKTSPGRVRYFASSEQAEVIQRDLQALAESVVRWLVDVPVPLSTVTRPRMS